MPFTSAWLRRSSTLAARHASSAAPSFACALKLAAQKVRQIEVGYLDIAANERFFLFVAGGIRQLDNPHVQALRPYPAGRQAVIGTKHAKSISVVCKGEVHRYPLG
jgi:hypothetical protein